ncbi:hypothetical protein [Candidatus Manganitrophus noduliformans]|uniref:hypothetical protein n=1 Tax=Candidatus Manganitrophus noduliformans TaxID=2606439 RepID=UPI00143C540C|nr:hypothetical protein [Candidatus Manganitrophus noduliformans]
MKLKSLRLFYLKEPRVSFPARFAAFFSCIVLAGFFLVCFFVSLPLLIVSAPCVFDLHSELFTNPQLGLLEDIIQTGEAGKGEIFSRECAGFRFEGIGFKGRSTADFMGDQNHLYILSKGLDDLEQSRGRRHLDFVSGPV